jgi:hypothetical protein
MKEVNPARANVASSIQTNFERNKDVLMMRNGVEPPRLDERTEFYKILAG